MHAACESSHMDWKYVAKAPCIDGKGKVGGYCPAIWMVLPFLELPLVHIGTFPSPALASVVCIGLLCSPCIL